MRHTEMYTVKPTKGEYRFKKEDGTLVPPKTPQDKIHIIQFTAVRNCRLERCPIHDLCVYTKNSNEKCKVELLYLDAVFKSLCNIVRNKMTQEVMNKFTLHILPLHQMLIRFKIKAYSVEDVCFSTVQGAIKVHPIFKEIRETINSIEKTQKSMGLDLEYTRALGMIGKRPKDGVDPHGDSDYWDDWKDDLESDIFPEGTKKGETLNRNPEEEE